MTRIPECVAPTLMLRMKSVRHGLSRCKRSSISESWAGVSCPLVDDCRGVAFPEKVSDEYKICQMSALIKQESELWL